MSCRVARGPTLRRAPCLPWCFIVDVLIFLRSFKHETLYFNFAAGLENYVADPGQGALNQRLISRNTSWHEQEKHDVVTLLVVRAGDRGSPQVILEPNIIEPGRG